MAIKKLQSNWTTAEQSKRLLELGIPADSADCYLNSDSVIVLNGKTFQENYNEDLDLARLHLIEYPHYVPCWSVGRLIDIFEICTGELFERKRWKESSNILLNDVLEQIELAVINTIEGVEFNFSKLEE